MFDTGKSGDYTVPTPINTDYMHAALLRLDYIFCNPNRQGYIIDQSVLYNSGINLINTASTGTNHIDLEYCKKNKIKILSKKNDFKLINKLPSTSELAFGLMINLLKK